jgi:para-aminobenzoate synthetase / 4-amino-4-deoxychorismate lyase
VLSDTSLPTGTSVFNIPIRTIEIRGETGRMGIGSGIVWDSDPEKEYEECMLKARFLTEPYKPVTLIESLRYENGYLRLEKHLDRLIDSAAYFDIPVQREALITLLDGHVQNLQPDGIYKVRLTVDESGELHIESSPISATEDEPVRSDYRKCILPPATDSSITRLLTGSYIQRNTITV